MITFLEIVCMVDATQHVGFERHDVTVNLENPADRDLSTKETNKGHLLFRFDSQKVAKRKIGRQKGPVRKKVTKKTKRRPDPGIMGGSYCLMQRPSFLGLWVALHEPYPYPISCQIYPDLADPQSTDDSDHPFIYI